MCVCEYTYTYIHVCAYILTYLHIHFYVSMNIDICVSICYVNRNTFIYQGVEIEATNIHFNCDFGKESKFTLQIYV